MATHDIKSDLKQTLGMYQEIASDTTTNGFIIDTAHFDLGLMFGVSAPAYTAGTFDFTIEQGDDASLADAAAVDSEQLIGSLAGLQLTAATAEGDTMQTIGLFSNKRYVRINAVSTGGGNATIAAVVTEKAELAPV